jgi:hypothetical protein
MACSMARESNHIRSFSAGERLMPTCSSPDVLVNGDESGDQSSTSKFAKFESLSPMKATSLTIVHDIVNMVLCSV